MWSEFMLQRNFRAALLVAAALCAACTTSHVRLYEGPGRPAAQTATISMPEQLEVAGVNGVEIEGASGLLTKGDRTLEVVPGRYEVLAYYREVWERGDDHDVLRSDPALFVVDAGAGGRYRLEYARPGGYADAQRLAGSFEGWVEDLRSGERTASRDSDLRFRTGLIPALTFDETLVGDAGDAASGQRVAPLPPAASAAGEPESAANQRPRDSSREWLTLMKGWWNEASPAERREFLLWVGERR
jgi:hypothetical protein